MYLMKTKIAINTIHLHYPICFHRNLWGWLNLYCNENRLSILQLHDQVCSHNVTYRLRSIIPSSCDLSQYQLAYISKVYPKDYDCESWISRILHHLHKLRKNDDL